MTDEASRIKSEAYEIRETAIRIDRLLTEAKEMAVKLEATSDALNEIVSGRENNASRE